MGIRGYRKHPQFEKDRVAKEKQDPRYWEYFQFQVEQMKNKSQTKQFPS